jgi:hypothetical protein
MQNYKISIGVVLKRLTCKEEVKAADDHVVHGEMLLRAQLHQEHILMFKKMNILLKVLGDTWRRPDLTGIS